MTFQLETSNNRIFKESFDSISRIVDEITLIIDTEGLKLTTLDRSHTTFIIMELDKTVFDEFECTTPEKICIDVNEFMKVLRNVKSNDILRLNVDEGNFIVTFIGDATRKFKLRLIDNDYEPQVPPKISHPVKISIPSTILTDALKDMSIFSDKLQFLINENYLHIRSDGEFGDTNTEYLHGENILTTACSTFGIDKLTDILRSSKFSNEMELELGDDMPLKLTLKLPTGDGILQYLLAPRIEEQD